MIQRIIFLMLMLCAAAASRTRVDLSGAWVFAPDYPNAGVAHGWHRPGIDETSWDAVDVPHIWNLEPRYDYTGPAWYRKTFTAPPLKPGEQARLLFGAVFYKAHVWLNGVDLGEHEGGYTAFELDTKGALKPGAENLLAVRVDNSWSAETVPGSRPGGQPRDQTYPWWNFGGIKKPVILEILPAVYVANQKIAATPDLDDGTAVVQVRVWVRNTTNTEQRRPLRIRVRRPGAWDPAATAEASVRVAANTMAEAEATLRLPAPVALWDFDHPRLYESLVELADGADQHQARFGVRKLEIRDAKLLLNGEAVSFGGANRAADHPRYGSMETKTVIDQDLSLMKSANMGLARILHYPPSQTLLDWCDEHGFLVIAEAGNWGLLPEQMDSPKLRAVWQSQAREMVEQSWNHPAVIGWSVGNEYQSDTPAGVRWTRDMIAFVRALDATRFTTFVSLGGKIFSKVKPEENSFHYADILCPNIYGNGGLARSMETLHATWPDKPVLITEYGWREDTAYSESWRAQQFREAMAILRKYPFVIGASVWSWSDYRSRHFGTNPDGYRHWGLVTPDRKPRESYWALREELSPAAIQDVKIDRRPVGLMASFAVQVTVEGRNAFPSRVQRDHEVVVSLLDRDGNVRKSHSQRVAELKPGDRHTATIPVSPFDISAATRIRVEWKQPTGFIGVEKVIEVRPAGAP